MSTISAGAILQQAFALLRASLPGAAIAFAALAALGMVIDTGLAGTEGAGLLNLVASGAAVFAQYRLTRTSLGQVLGRPPDGGGIGPFIGLGILSGLGILAGFVVLIVPGIVLMIRWSMSTPILLATQEGVTASMARSWRETEGKFWPILLAFLAIWVPGVALFAAGSYALDSAPGSLAGALLANLGLVGAQILGWYAAVALFALIERPETLGEVFE